MYSDFVFLDRFLFELSCKNTHTHTNTHRDSNEYPIVAFSRNATIIKWIMTCVSLNGLSEFNTQYFFMEMVRFESQEYTLQSRMQFFAKLDKIRLFKASLS